MGTKTDQVEQAIRELAKSDLGPSGKLPSERTLEKQLSAGRTTIRQVLAKLTFEGVVRKEPQRGYFATMPREDFEPAAGNPEPWQIHGERLVYDNKWVRLALVDVEPPGGERFEHHVVRLSRVAITALIDSRNRVLMMWRYRFVPQRFGWELPGGIIEPGESGPEAAAREIEEETGWKPAGNLRRIISFQPMIGMVDSPHELYVGHGAEHVSVPREDAEESARIAWIPLADIPGMIERDELIGAGTLVTLLHILATAKANAR